MIRVRASRALCRWLVGRDVMLCAVAHDRRWRLRHALNLLVPWHWHRDHCALCSSWESAQDQDEGGYVEACRRGGLL